MEGENLYKISRERQELRKAAKDENLPEAISRSASEGVREMKEELSDLIGKVGGLSKAKERFRTDRASAEAAGTGDLDLTTAAESMGGEKEVFLSVHSLAEKLDGLRDFEMRRTLEKKTDPYARKTHERLLEAARKERETLENQSAELRAASPRAEHAFELIRYKEGLAREGHIAPTPTVAENLKRIGRNMLVGKPIFLHGPTGTGKTSQARYAAAHFTGKNAEMIYCNPQTREANIWGKTGIRPVKESGAIETVDIFGPLAKAMQDGKAVIFDEFNSLPVEQMVFIKGVFNAKIGDEVNVVGNGRVKVAPGFQMIFTANLKSEKNPERQALPPEIAREFEQNNIKINYLPKNEAYDVMLARLMNPDGSVDMSWRDMSETLPKLCEAMEEIQVAYTGELRSETGRLINEAGASGRARGLKKLVMTQGTVEAILEDWRVEREEHRGVSFAEHIDLRLKVGLTFAEYPLEDRMLAAKTFAAKGFLRTLSPDELGLPADIFSFDAAKRLRGDDKARAEMVQKLSEESQNEKHITLKELADLDPFGVRAKQREVRLAALRGMLTEKGRKLGSETVGERETSFERAQEIMGERMLGPEEVKQVFGIEVETVPAIPFPEDMLEKLKGSCRLILYADKFADGTPVTGQTIMKRLDNKKADGSKLFHDTDWYKAEDFFTKESPQLRWRIVLDEVIPGSTSQNYLVQTETLANFAESRYDDITKIPQDIKEMIDEARALANDANFRSAVESTDETKWKPAAEKLAALPLNRHFRESFPELIYRLALVDRAKAEQLLKGMYLWTCSRTSDGDLVYGGLFGAGAEVYGYGPDGSGSDVGCAFSAEKL